MLHVKMCGVNVMCFVAILFLINFCFVFVFFAS